MHDAVADNPWILAKHRRDRKIPYSASDGYGTVKSRGLEHSPSGADDNDEPSVLFLPTSDANFALPSVGNKLVILTTGEHSSTDLPKIFHSSMQAYSRFVFTYLVASDCG